MTYTIRPVEPRDDKRVGEIIRYCLNEYNAPKEGSALADPDLRHPRPSHRRCHHP